MVIIAVRLSPQACAILVPLDWPLAHILQGKSLQAGAIASLSSSKLPVAASQKDAGRPMALEMSRSTGKQENILSNILPDILPNTLSHILSQTCSPIWSHIHPTMQGLFCSPTS